MYGAMMGKTVHVLLRCLVGVCNHKRPGHTYMFVNNVVTLQQNGETCTEYYEDIPCYPIHFTLEHSAHVTPMYNAHIFQPL